MKEKSKTPLFYEQERASHLQNTQSNLQKLNTIKSTLFGKDEISGGSSSSALKVPSIARKEVESLRDYYASIKDFNEQQRFLGKRERLISKGWRHGIVGVDDADSPKTQVFY